MYGQLLRYFFYCPVLSELTKINNNLQNEINFGLPVYEISFTNQEQQIKNNIYKSLRITE